jgi:hypothetical protein
MRRLWTDVQQSQTVTYEQAKELFNLRCRSRNLSPLTLGWYKVVLGGFMRFLEASGGHSTLEMATFPPRVGPVES